MSDNQCINCGGLNTYHHEQHPDTGMDEMVLRCRDCDAKKPRLPLSFRIREGFRIRRNKLWGRFIVRPLFILARRSAKMTSDRCTFCGSMPGFASSISRKGLRCIGHEGVVG